MELLAARRRSEDVARSLYCSHGLQYRCGYLEESLRETFLSFDRDERGQLLAWLSQRGPFLEQDRESEEDDLFYFDSEDVTDLGLGEAARRVMHMQSAAVYSIDEGAARDFSISPLEVLHGLLEAPYTALKVPNFRSIEELTSGASSALPEPDNWDDAFREDIKRYDRLVIGNHSLEHLYSTPFSPALAKRISKLLEILHKLMLEMGEDGTLTSAGEEIRQAHFVGKKALFSDESDSNKAQFRREMTFVDPEDDGNRITCFWHGKINTPKFRVHFEWPVASPKQGMRIPYIGPKISKK